LGNVRWALGRKLLVSGESKNMSLLKSVIQKLLREPVLQQPSSEFEITRTWGLWPDRNLNPLTRNPRRYFSQSDEDGIIEKILFRLGVDNRGKILELGVGDGRENNSLALIAKGWDSYWIGGEDLSFNFPISQNHHFKKTWIALHNVVDLTTEALVKLNANNRSVDVVSIDLDGNDWHFVSKLLESSLYPNLWICEYNAKFPPGSNWVMPYDEAHTWQSDDYFGASFTSFVALFRKHGYFPVACSVQGANVFFVREDHRSKFLDIGVEEESLYQPPFYYLVPKWGHSISSRTIESIFQFPKD
jgi:hypothetical protein